MSFLQIQDLSKLLGSNKIEISKELLKLGVPKKNAQRNSIDSTWVRQLLLQKKFKYPSQTVSFQMLKGGVAKTTSAHLLGKRLSQYGAKVLFVDLDQQANLSSSLGFENENCPVWVDLIEGKVNVSDLIVKLDENLDLIPSNLNNSVIDRVLMRTSKNWSMCVKGPLSKIKMNYDFIIIDLAPALSVINTASSIASDLAILPVNPDKFSFVGLEKHLQELNVIQEEYGHQLKTRVLFTKFDVREKLSQVYLQHVIEKYQHLLLQTYIRNSSEMKNSLEENKDLFAFKNVLKEDFDSLCLEILGWELPSKAELKGENYASY